MIGLQKLILGENMGAKQCCLDLYSLLHKSTDALCAPKHQSFSFLLDTTKTSTAFGRANERRYPNILTTFVSK